MTEDEQEAYSIKYNVARIVRLNSGNLALFYPWDNHNGMPLQHIGSVEEVIALIPTTEEVIAYCERISASEPQRQYRIKSEPNNSIAREFLAKIGLIKPEEPIKRRI